MNYLQRRVISGMRSSFSTPPSTFSFTISSFITRIKADIFADVLLAVVVSSVSLEESTMRFGRS